MPVFEVLFPYFRKKEQYFRARPLEKCGSAWKQPAIEFHKKKKTLQKRSMTAMEKYYTKH